MVADVRPGDLNKSEDCDDRVDLGNLDDESDSGSDSEATGEGDSKGDDGAGRHDRAELNVSQELGTSAPEGAELNVLQEMGTSVPIVQEDEDEERIEVLGDSKFAVRATSPSFAVVSTAERPPRIRSLRRGIAGAEGSDLPHAPCCARKLSAQVHSQPQTLRQLPSLCRTTTVLGCQRTFRRLNGLSHGAAAGSGLVANAHPRTAPGT